MNAHDMDESSLNGKFAILEAMNELCETRPFSRLSVVDIAKKAGISRSNFYYHFTDRNDAVRWLSRLAFSRGIDKIGRTLGWRDGHFATTHLLSKYKPLIVAASEDSDYSSAMRFFLRHRKATLCQTLSDRGIELTDELLFQIEALAASEQYMTISYLRGELGELEPLTFSDLLDGIVPDALRRAIELE
ncbi:MAG: TetR family transcriptional regulator [Eggerthellaceae bacterium]|nr:TetR family transcriptional regulator [Eggerthellaceae bacterium]